MIQSHTLSDLMTFVAIVEEQSFTQAAHKLHITHSVVSKRIRRLESSLKVRLLNRTTRHLMLTESGELFYERCLQIKKNIDDMTQLVEQKNAKPSGTIRINAPMSFGQLHLTPALCEFIQHYPDIRVELVLGRQYTNLLKHRLDMSIQISELSDSSLIAKRLAVRSTKICASPHYFERQQETRLPKTPADLKRYDCLIYQSQYAHDDWRFIDKQGTILQVKVKGKLHANSSQAIKRAALSGLGIARLPSYLIDQEIKRGELLDLLTDYCPKDIGIYAVYSHSRYLATKVRVLIDFLAAHFHTEQNWCIA